MNILVIGSGGRESAIAWSVARSPLVRKVFISPGNGGTLKYGENILLSLEYPFGEVIDFCEDAEIDLVIVGPETPLVDGIVDCLRREGIKTFGPTKKAAQLEGSKSFMKEFLARNTIPTARFRIFDDPKAAVEYVAGAGKPFVVKTDGLAAGKGAIVNKTVQETLDSINRIMVKREFGDAGNRIVVEDLLEGEEVSVFILTDGKDYRWLASAQDHKRIFDGDEGPNTGGMGAYAPVPFLDSVTRTMIEENIIKPTVAGMAKEGNPYTGILYFGLMLTPSGPSVIEYNVRLGDPEAQVILPLLETDFLTAVWACMHEELSRLTFGYYDGYCTGVVIAAEGYPDSYRKGDPLAGSFGDETNCFVFHAGTKALSDGRVVTNGGRVLCVSALGTTLEQSIRRAYEKAAKIDFAGKYYRKDIGAKGLKAIKNNNIK
ncbi:MAG: phosphoribosylamine--glycine ligase [Spirochaetes bacterium GWF1_51_8]|nr:MAG: phosphoribosylamine--glycine ligase [Spirochaetes bacterium GWF1_51_8]